jgi:hypothetical protein
MMRVDTVLELAREFSRTNATAMSDTDMLRKLNIAIKAFAKDTYGCVKEAYLDVEPKFNISTTFALKITITGGTNALAETDVAICSADENEITGTAVATALQAAIRAAIGVGASLTVAWSLSTWKFTVDAIDSTEIEIEAPGMLYADATELLGLSGTGTTSIIGVIPEDCNLVVDLPSDYYALKTNPVWDKDELYPAPASIFEAPETQGEPRWYHIERKKIRLYPTPTKQERFHILYRYIPASITTVKGYQELGLSGLGGTTLTGLSASTPYKFKITVDGGTAEDITVTTASDLTWTAVLALINAALAGSTYSSGATASIVGGDARFVSSSEEEVSSISLAAPSSGTNMLEALTGFTAVETAVASEAGDEIDINDDFAIAIVYYTAYLLAQINYESAIAKERLAMYWMEVNKHIVTHANRNVKLEPKVVKPSVNIEVSLS